MALSRLLTRLPVLQRSPRTRSALVSCLGGGLPPAEQSGLPPCLGGTPAVHNRRLVSAAGNASEACTARGAQPEDSHLFQGILSGMLAPYWGAPSAACIGSHTRTCHSSPSVRQYMLHPWQLRLLSTAFLHYVKTERDKLCA